MKIVINGKERMDIIKITIQDKMIDFETERESSYFLFSDLDNSNNKIEITDD